MRNNINLNCRVVMETEKIDIFKHIQGIFKKLKSTDHGDESYRGVKEMNRLDMPMAFLYFCLPD